MDGLEDQAEAAIGGLLDQLRRSPKVEVGRSSRSLIIQSLCQELREAGDAVVTKTLVLRGGMSETSLRLLHQVLPSNTSLHELQFYCLSNVEQLRLAIECCRIQPRITSLVLKSYTPAVRTRRQAEGGEVIARAIRDAVLGDPSGWHDDDARQRGIPSLLRLEITGYPLGTHGTQVLMEAVEGNATLQVLGLLDCDVRSDCAKGVAQMIRGNQCLQELDLSFNRHFPGSELTREMTFKTLVRRGMQYNTSLLQFRLAQNNHGGGQQRNNRHKTLEKHLRISRFYKAYLETQCNPFDIPHPLWKNVLATVSPKPSILFVLLCKGAGVLFQ